MYAKRHEVELDDYENKKSMSFKSKISAQILRFFVSTELSYQSMKRNMEKSGYLPRSPISCIRVVIMTCIILSMCFNFSILETSQSIMMGSGGPTYKSKRIAVVIAGSLERFHLNSTVEHFLKPVVKQGHSVDFFVSLTTAWKPKALNEKKEKLAGGTTYADRLHWDPIFTNNKILTNSVKPLKDEEISKVTRRAITEAGGKLRGLTLQESVDIDNDKQLKARRQKALKKNKKEDPDLRFPLLDMRSDAAQAQTIKGNRNLLRQKLATFELWKMLQKAEETLTVQYDYVMFLTDDLLWLKDFDFSGLIHGREKFEAFTLACDARSPAPDPRELNSHGIIISRKKAKILGDFYSELFKADLDKCAKQLPKEIAQGGQRGCNVDMIMRWVMEQRNVKVHKVGQNEMPFQRSLSLVLPDGKLGKCFHSYCQSKKNKLPDFGVPKCTDVNYSKRKDAKKIKGKRK